MKRVLVYLGCLASWLLVNAILWFGFDKINNIVTTHNNNQIHGHDKLTILISGTNAIYDNLDFMENSAIIFFVILMFTNYVMINICLDFIDSYNTRLDNESN